MATTTESPANNPEVTCPVTVRTVVPFAPGQARSERQPVCAAGELRLAFYGRTSTVEHQDPVTSAAGQRESAEELIAGHGVVVAHYFDVGKSRSVPWGDRPEAAALLRALRDPGCGFDAIVVGEYERAFAGEGLARLLQLFRRYGGCGCRRPEVRWTRTPRSTGR